MYSSHQCHLHCCNAGHTKLLPSPLFCFLLGGHGRGGGGGAMEGQQEQQLFSPVYRTGRTQLRNKVCKLVRFGVLWVLCPPQWGPHVTNPMAATLRG